MGSNIRMKLETEKETLEETGKTLPYTPKTELGKKLLAIRAKIVASGTPLLNWEEIEEEVAARRGGLQNKSL